MNPEHTTLKTSTLYHRGGKVPLSKKGRKIMRSMTKQYGKKKGKKVFYASKNKGKIKGVEVMGY